ncbi:MAG: hypothetical protein ACO1NW_15710 [Chitinophagaceae bacterium]
MYLKRLFRNSKAGFAAVVLFIAGSLFFNFKTAETTPFFVWSMYSIPVKTDTFSTYRITLNEQVIYPEHAFRQPLKCMLFGPLQQYDKIMSNAGIDPDKAYYESTIVKRHRFFRQTLETATNKEAAISSFIPWLKKYLTEVTGENIRSLKLEKIETVFEQNGTPGVIATKTIYNEPKL